ncbi:MAG: tyrosine-protein phosphatase, partial [Clostridia bacterium]|nr:tyrosine-protein phosphatase [Clostridia bacterium]
MGGYATPDGKTVKRGIFLRTAALAGASNEDIQRLKEVYNLAVVIDLRMSREIEAKADPVIDEVKNLWIGIIDEEVLKKRREELDTSEIEDYDPNDKMSGLKIAMKLGIVGEQMYINFLSEDQGKKGYKQMFDELLSL